MKDNLSQVELAEMLLQLEEARETNLKLIEMKQDSLKGVGGFDRNNKIIWKQEIAELKEVMREQEEIRKKLLFSYVEQTISMDDVAKQLNK